MGKARPRATITHRPEQRRPWDAVISDTGETIGGFPVGVFVGSFATRKAASDAAREKLRKILSGTAPPQFR